MNHRLSQTMRTRMSLGLGVSVLMLCGAALADSDRLAPRQVLPLYQQECAACHLAYPPGLLSASSWSRIMKGLENHYGSDASLDPKSVAQIGQWLQTNAGTYKRVTEAPPQDRITRAPWFERKHRRIEAAVWKHASVKSAANCAACHTRADKGWFDDEDLKFPPGLDARYRAAWAED